MAPGTSSAEEATFSELIQQIEVAGNRKGSVKLSKDTVEKLNEDLETIRQSHKSVPGVVIERLVSILDVQERFCIRLETTTFITILKTLLQAEHSQQKERGCYLLAESIHYDSHKRSTSRTVEARRASIGKTCIQRLISCFTDANGNARVRRWIGAMILQLLDSDATRLSFEAGPEDKKRKLGSMVVEEGNEILRIICGRIIKVLLTWDIALKDLWPIDAGPELYAEFPLSSQEDKHWSNAFQAYVDQLFNSPDPSPCDTGRIYFVQAVMANPHEIRFSGCTISVFINGEVSICTQPYSESFMECLDIPLDLFTKFEVANTIFETEGYDGSEKTRGKIMDAADLIFTLTKSGISTCYTNAAPTDIREVRITTSNENLAHDIGSEIQYEIEKLKKKKGPKISQSREIIAVVRNSSENCPLLGTTPIDNYLLVSESQNSEVGAVNIFGTIVTPLEQIYDYNPKAKGVSSLPVKDSIGDEKAQYVNPKDVHYSTNKIAEANYEVLAPPQTLNSDRSQHLQLNIEDDYARQSLRDIPQPKPGRDAQDPADRAIDVLQNGYPLTGNQRVGLDYEGVQNAGYGADVVTQPPPSTPKCTKPIHDQYNLKLSGNSKNSSASPAKRRPVKFPLTEIKELKAAKAHKPNTVIHKIASQKRKKPGLIPKKPSQKSNTISSKCLPKPVFDGRAKGAEIQPSKSKRSELKVSAKEINQPSLRLAPEKKALKGTKIVEGMAAEPMVTKRDNILSKDPHERNFHQLAGTVAERFSYSLTESLGEFVDTDQLETIKGQAAPHIMSSQDQINAIETSISSTHQAIGSKEEVASLPNQPPAKKRKARQEKAQQPVRRSPRLMSPTKAAAVILNQVLVNRNPPADDKLTRKTPIVSFCAKGPLNQGIGSTEISHTGPRIEARNAASCPAVVKTKEVLRGSKSRRFAENLTKMEEMGPQQLSKNQVATASHSDRDLPLAFQNGQEPIFAKVSPAEQNLPVFGSQRSRVDEKGSPQALSGRYQQRMNFQDIAKKVGRDSLIHSRNDGSEDEHLNHVVDDCGLPHMQGASPQVLSNIPLSLAHQPKRCPAVASAAIGSVTRYVGQKRPLPDDLRGTAKEILAQQLIFAEPNEEQALSILVGETVARYTSHQRAIDRKFLKVEQGEGAVCQLVPADPFLEKISNGNLGNFARRLQQSSEEIRKYEPTACPLPEEPQKRKFCIFDEPEVTLVNIENQAASEDISPPCDTTDSSSIECQDLEQQISTMSSDLTLEDEWRMALKPYQKGVLDSLYQISNDLVRYLIGHEEAITDVLSDYLRNGRKLVNELDLKHKADRLHIHQELETAKNILRKAFADSRRQVLTSNHDMKMHNLLNVEQTWKAKHDLLERMVEEAQRQYD